MENYLYFAEADVETGDDGSSEALCVPASSFVGADPGNGTTSLYFKNAMGDNDGLHKIVLTHTAGKNKDVMRGVMACINAKPSNGGFVEVANANAAALTTGTIFNEVFDGAVTDVAITEIMDNGSIVGILDATTLSTSYGTGIVGTDGAPEYTRQRVGDTIITSIKISLNGLKAKGGDAGDAIGVGTSPAYFYKNVVAENGIIFRQELICLETAAQASGTVTDDINVAWNSAATIDYDEAAGTGSEINAGALATGGIVVEDAAVITADHYAYLTEGSTEASDCVFNAGCYMLKLYGAVSL
jgi:hypothetical protein